MLMQWNYRFHSIHQSDSHPKISTQKQFKFKKQTIETFDISSKQEWPLFPHPTETTTRQQTKPLLTGKMSCLSYVYARYWYLVSIEYARKDPIHPTQTEPRPCFNSIAIWSPTQSIWFHSSIWMEWKRFDGWMEEGRFPHFIWETAALRLDWMKWPRKAYIFFQNIEFSCHLADDLGSFLIVFFFISLR